MASPKPTFLFVPGAWHKSTCYGTVISKLHTLGYPTATADLASVGPTPGLETWDPDIQNIHTALSTLISSGKHVILVTHSYSSLPAGEAAKPFLLPPRSKEKPGLLHIIYISAFLLPPGKCLMDALHNVDLPWFIVSLSKREVRPQNPEEVFYNDLPPADQQKWTADLEVFSYRMFFQKTTYVPWEHVGASFVFCTQDRAIPFEVQRGMVDAAGGGFRETVVEAGHSPFLSRVDEVVGALVGAAESL